MGSRKQQQLLPQFQNRLFVELLALTNLVNNLSICGPEILMGIMKDNDVIHVVFAICTAVSLPVLSTKVNVCGRNMGKKGLGNINKMLDGPAASQCKEDTDLAYTCTLLLKFVSNLCSVFTAEVVDLDNFKASKEKYFARNSWNRTTISSASSALPSSSSPPAHLC